MTDVDGPNRSTHLGINSSDNHHSVTKKGTAAKGHTTEKTKKIDEDTVAFLSQESKGQEKWPRGTELEAATSTVDAMAVEEKSSATQWTA